MITVRNHLRHNSCRESVTKCFERKGNLMPASDIGIDLGTRNSQVYSTGRGLVVSEPSVVVYDKNSEKIKAIGEEARQITGHVSSNNPANPPGSDRRLYGYGEDAEVFHFQGNGSPCLSKA